MIIFPDTNLFLHFRDPAELDWSAVTTDADIRLVVGRTAQKEIQKKRYELRGRPQDRARRYAKLLGDMAATRSHRVERETGPRVELHYVARPDGWSAPPDLDKDWGDDQLVADALAYRSLNPGLEVAVLSDDAEVIATAFAHGVTVLRAPDDWELPPEATADQRTIARLQAENRALNERGPKIACAVESGADRVEHHVALRANRRGPLPDEVVAELARRVAEAHPEPARFDLLSDGTVADPKTYRTPAQPEIQTYRMARTAWLDGVKRTIQAAGQTTAVVRAAFPFALTLENLGVEPANGLRVLVEVTAGLTLFEQPPAFAFSDPALAPFDAPPAPPRPSIHASVLIARAKAKAQAKTGTSLADLAELDAAYGGASGRLSGPLGAAAFDPLGRRAHGAADLFGDRRYGVATVEPVRVTPLAPPMPQFKFPEPPAPEPPRDPQKFYWLGEGRRHDVRRWEFECARFQHQGRPFDVPLAIVARLPESGPLEGEIKIQAEAANLRTPFKKTITVKIDVDHLDPAAAIAALVVDAIAQ
jgi:hypothetical protein